MSHINFNTHNNETFITIDNNIYQVLSDENESINMVLYRNKAEEERVDKTEYLEMVDIILGTLREETDITSPSMEIAYSKIPDFNYVYIDVFDRYYFVDSFSSVRQGYWYIELSEDVLMSYKEAIKNIEAFVDRNEFEYNEKIIDNKMVIEQGNEYEIIDIPNNLFEQIGKDDHCFVITGYALGLNEDYPVPPTQPTNQNNGGE